MKIDGTAADQIGPKLANFGGRTLRQVVRLSIGGSAIRIRLSNRFGTSPVTISDIRYARATSDRDAASGTDHRITFAGVNSVTLKPGQEILSDPLTTTVASGADVSISMYFPNSLELAHLTGHRQAWQHVYFAAGDVAGSPQIAPVDQADNFFFLSGIDVVNAASGGSIVALGASITDGSNSSFGQNRRWTDLLSRRLTQSGLALGVLNAGLSGNHLLTDELFGGPSAFNRFQHDVLDQPNVRWVIFSDDPINDMSGRSTVDVQPLESFTSLVTRMTAAAHARGIRFYCSTLTPNKGREAWLWSDGAERVRQQLATFYRSSASGCDAVIDQDLATHDPADPLQYRPSFNGGDSLHPNDDGTVAIADSINLGLFTSSGVPPFTTPSIARCGRMLPGEGLRAGQSLRSCDGRFTAKLQSDGNLVVLQGAQLLGSTGTAGRGATSAIFMADGRLVLLGSAGQLVWQTDTAGLLGKVLLLQDDGNFVMYDHDGADARPLWNSNTFGR